MTSDPWAWTEKFSRTDQPSARSEYVCMRCTYREDRKSVV